MTRGKELNQNSGKGQISVKSRWRLGVTVINQVICPGGWKPRKPCKEGVPANEGWVDGRIY